MNSRELVAWNMRRLRVAQALSQHALADKAAIDRTYVSRLERMIENPSIGILDKIAEALGTTIPELFVEPDPADLKPEPLKAGRKPSA